MHIIDTHTHLNSSPLIEDINEVINRAKNNNIEKFIVIGYDLETSKKAIEIATFYDGICYAVVGIHPSEINDNYENDLLEIEKLISDKHVIGIGEIGLDYHYDNFDKELQKEVFEKQIKLANKYHKPIIIHSRDAALDTYNILNSNKQYIENSGIMHCYSYSKEMVNMFTDLGLYIAFGGSLTFKNGRVAKEAIAATPIDKILFETDSPYLAPHPYRGEINEPKNIVLVLKEASIILNIEEEKLSDIVYQNTKRLFNI